MLNINYEERLIERIFWLIKLRWVAGLGVLLTAFISYSLLRVSINTPAIYLFGGILLGYNILFLLYTRYILLIKKSIHRAIIANRIANLQISLDLFILAGLIHFSGGIENPFIFYFIFHMIIASILLSARASYLQASFAVFLFGVVITLEFFNILPHFCLEGFIAYDLHTNIRYISGVSFVFVTTLYIAVYMATSISTKLRQQENRLHQANKLLEDKDRIKSEYVLHVSHDIKEDLSAIKGCIEPVTSGITGALNTKQKDLLQRAEERTDKLVFFVRALLELTRLKLSKKIKMDYFSIGDIIKSAILSIELKAQQKNISIGYNISSSINKIKGVKEYIEESIKNLLANSVKYTSNNGKIDINVADKDESILIEIKDTGIGIPRDELPKIFDEFYRATNAKEIERGGTGLGLSIVKQVVDMHAGKIWVESEEGEGSKFSILLAK